MMLASVMQLQQRDAKLDDNIVIFWGFNLYNFSQQKVVLIL
jgi:hypothetical protein